MRLYQSTHLAVAVAGVGASLPGAVAPYEFAFVELVEGFGGGVVVGGTHGSGGGLDPLLDESSGIVDGQVLRSAVAVVHHPLQVRAPAFLARLDRVFQGAKHEVGAPRARAGGPADDAAGVQVHDERRVAEPRPGRHVGEVDHPSAVRAGGGDVAAQQVAGARSPSAGPVARSFLPGAAPDSPSARMRLSTVHRATRGRPSWALRRRQVFLDPSAALNGSSLRARILSSTAASNTDLFEGGRDRAA